MNDKPVDGLGRMRVIIDHRLTVGAGGSFRAQGERPYVIYTANLTYLPQRESAYCPLLAETWLKYHLITA